MASLTSSDASISCCKWTTFWPCGAKSMRNSCSSHNSVATGLPSKAFHYSTRTTGNVCSYALSHTSGLLMIETMAQPPDISRVALKAFFRMAAKWQLQDADIATLLGCRSEDLDGLRNGTSVVLDEEKLTRISHLLKIYKLLHILFGPGERAYQWPSRPNTAPPFNGQSAMVYMLSGQLSDIAAVHHYLRHHVERY